MKAVDAVGNLRVTTISSWGAARWLVNIACVGLLFMSVSGSAAAAGLGDLTSALGEECPNELLSGFRVGLPDCRAYEQVTPAFKDDAEVRLKAISSDGAEIIGESLGGFAGSEIDTKTGSEYLFARSASGWEVSPVSPPASSFPAQEFLAASPNLERTLWLARTPSESIAAENFYVREGDSSMQEIGPGLPPSTTGGPAAREVQYFLDSGRLVFLAASDDLTNVLFRMFEGHTTGFSWPGDTTLRQRSLYEYSGRGQTHPELVGVNAEGHLISSCETFLGSQEEDDLYNAVSESGETVFFTAAGQNVRGCGGEPAPEVSELYARLNQSETVPISEPTEHQCAGCNTAVKAPAEFAGASRDGTKVFFLSEQVLLAGASGENLYEYNFDAPAGEHVTRVAGGIASAPEVQGVSRVSEDGTHVYFVARGRLTAGAREGDSGVCLSELSGPERSEEEVARAQEEKAEAVTEGARCRPKAEADNLYVYIRDATHPTGAMQFIATLCSGQEVSGAVSDAQCSSPTGDTKDWQNLDERMVQATPNGQFVVFESSGHLIGGENTISMQPQIFEYDAGTEELIRASRGSNSFLMQGTENANKSAVTNFAQPYDASGVSPTRAYTGLAVSADGATVAFSSIGALTEGALEASHPNDGSAYEYESAVNAGGTLRDGNVYLISDGTNRLKAEASGVDESGNDIYFTTADSLVPGDTDTQYDLYDARVNGGFAPPDPFAGCQTCAAMFSEQGEPSMAGTSAQSGVETLAASPRNDFTTPSLSSKAIRASVLRARHLTIALKVCRRRPKGASRTHCETLARKRLALKEARGRTHTSTTADRPRGRSGDGAG